jgi:hypothetical protein
MANTKTSVYAIFSNREAASTAIDALREARFGRDDISLLYPDNTGSKEFGVEAKSKASDGAAVGAGSGAVAGGVFGWLAGIGAIAIPGVGPFIAAGPIMAALAGAGVAGVAGGLTGALAGAGMTEYEAKRYEGRIQKGGFLLSVHCRDSDQTKTAKEILRTAGGEDISSSAEATSRAASRPPQRPVVTTPPAF